MDLKRCSNGHFYDGDSYVSCPHCSNGNISYSNAAGAISGNQSYGDEPTERLGQYEDISSNDSFVTKPLKDLVKEFRENENENENDNDNDDFEDDDNRTVGYFEKSIGSDPVVGWLVCVEGNHFGEDFKLKAGKNFIGRSKEMNICLSGDKSVSRERHLVVLYDPNNNIFIVQSGDSKELSYHNEKLVLSPVELKPYDVLKVGETKLLFIPFCSDKFVWSITEGKDNDNKE